MSEADGMAELSIGPRSWDLAFVTAEESAGEQVGDEGDVSDRHHEFHYRRGSVVHFRFAIPLGEIGWGRR